MAGQDAVASGAAGGRRFVTWGIVALVVAAGVLAALPRAARADDAQCGGSKNPCPLEKWMRANMGTPLAGDDLATVGKSMDFIGGKAPDSSYSNWASIAKTGSDAAKSGDTGKVKASCKSCHDQYKAKYRGQYRSRAFP
jgi:hypothetical protein